MGRFAKSFLHRGGKDPSKGFTLDSGAQILGRTQAEPHIAHEDRASGLNLQDDPFSVLFDGSVSIEGSTKLSGTLNMQDNFLRDVGELEHSGSNAGFFGVTTTTQPSALTAADSSTVDGTYGTEEQNVIDNLRTRVNELESKLQALGLLA